LFDKDAADVASFAEFIPVGNGFRRRDAAMSSPKSGFAIDCTTLNSTLYLL
jgi:hypothetical protein